MSGLSFLKLRGIGVKLVLWFLAVALLPLLTVGTLAIRQAALTIREEVTTNLAVVADAKTQRIDDYFTEARHSLFTTSRNPLVVDAMTGFAAAWNKGADSAEYLAVDARHRAFLTDYQQYYQEQTRYYDLFLIAPNGDIVFTVIKEDDFGTNLETGRYKDSELAKAFRATLETHKTSISDFRYYGASDEPAAFIAAPVFESGQFAGVIALQFSVSHIVQLAEDRTGLGSTGETMFVSRDGDDALVISPLRHDPEAAFQRRIKMGSSSSLPAQKALQQEQGAGISTDYRSKETLAAWRYLPDIRWGVVTKIDTTEAFASSRRLQQWFLIAGVITVLAVMLAAILVARSISRPIVRLTASVVRIASGNLEERVEVASSDETGQLASEFNHMAEQVHQKMVELSEQEARTATILNSTADGILTISASGRILSCNAATERLFGRERDQIVDHDLSLLLPDHVSSDALRSHQTSANNGAAGHETETQGQRADGTIVPLALRLSTIENQDERLTLVTVQDITERKQIELERQRLFEGIRDAVSRLSSASTEILAGATQQTHAADAQAGSVSKTTSAIQVISDTAQRSVERARHVEDSANRADEVSKSGRQAIDATTTAIQSVREQVETTAQTILSLAERAMTIFEITSTVNEIADRTNLLALNAQIEASSAGEAGKGFSVVANEVKSLAQQAKQATGQIGQILREIQAATNAAVNATEQGTQSVAEADSVVTQTRETIESLATTVGESASAASEILGSASQQAEGLNELANAMAQIEQTSEQSLASARQSEHLARDLQQLGTHLQQLLDA